MKFLAFAASHRKESLNAKLLRLACEQAEKQGSTVNVLEYGSLDAPLFDAESFPHAPLPASIVQLVEKLKEANGIIIASPEYNWSFPGSLKNIIDWVSTSKLHPLEGKTALLISASPSMRGGLQGLLQLRVPLDHLGVFVFPQFFALGRAEDSFDTSGHFIDPALAKEYGQLMEAFINNTKVHHA